MEDYFQLITNYYKPSEPIKDPNLFVGRNKEKTLIYKSLMAPGRSPVIYGPRGIGKTSLVNIACGFLGSQNDYAIIRHGCSSSDNFGSIFNTFLRKISENLVTKQIIKKESNDATGGFNLSILKAEAKNTTANETTYNSIIETTLTPALIAEHFCVRKVVLIIDELDQLHDPESFRLIADTIKALSDSNSLTKIILSGVSNSLISLVGIQQSTIRNLISIEVPRMSESELINIITNGTSKLDISFCKPVMDNIVWLSDGLPYFTHLISECLADFLIYSKKKTAQIEDLEKVLGNVVDNMALKEIVEQNYINTYSSSRQRFFGTVDALLDKDKDTWGDFTKKTVLNLLSKFENANTNIYQSIHREYVILRATTHKLLEDLELVDIEIILELMSKKTDMISQISGKYYFKDSFHKVYTRIESLKE